MTNIIKNCKGENKRGVMSAEGLRRKLFIAEHEIYESIEHRLKSKIGKIFVKEEILEEYSVKFMKLILILLNIIQKKYKLKTMVKNIYCLGLIFFY